MVVLHRFLLSLLVLLLFGVAPKRVAAGEVIEPLPTAAVESTSANEPSSAPAAVEPPHVVAETPQAPPPTALSFVRDPHGALRELEERAFPRPVHPVAGVVIGIEAKRSQKISQEHRSAWDPPHALISHTMEPSADNGENPAPAWFRRLTLPDFPVRWNDRIQRYLELYRNDRRGRAIFAALARRMGRYLPMLRRKLRDYELPQALVFLAMIESGFDPRQTSRVGAAGIWQFMPATGRAYGLRRDHWIDERRNPERSTDAALRYLRNLYTRLGSWELAMAAYNAGFGAVVEAMQKYNTNDYWQLCRYEAGLPWATTLYVPKIIAAAIVGLNLEAFGYPRNLLESPQQHDLARVPPLTSVATIARAAGVSEQDIEALNPELRRGRTPPATAWVRIPHGKRSAFYVAMARRRGAVGSYRAYRVRLGDTPDAIARRYALSTRALCRLNGLARSRELRPGLTIIVPDREPTPPPAHLSVRENDKTLASTSGPSATATSPQVTAEEQPPLVALRPGLPTAVPGRRRVLYRVVLGDSLWSIASHLDTTVEQLARWNGLNPSAKIVSKMVLQAFVAPDFREEGIELLDPATVQIVASGSDDFLNRYEQRKGRERLIYRVRPGDTLTRVSRRFGLRLPDLMRINGLGPNTLLQPGQKIVVYVPQRDRKRHRQASDEGRTANRPAVPNS